MTSPKPQTQSGYAAGTPVDWRKSRLELERVLDRYGATQFALVDAEANVLIRFTIGGRAVQMALPLPDRSSPRFTHTPTGKPRSLAAHERAYEQALRQQWRALVLVARGKLQAVESGISTIAQEFHAASPIDDDSAIDEWQSDAPVEPRTLRSLRRGSRSVLLVLGVGLLVPVTSFAALTVPAAAVEKVVAPLWGTQPAMFEVADMPSAKAFARVANRVRIASPAPTRDDSRRGMQSRVAGERLAVERVASARHVKQLVSMLDSAPSSAPAEGAAAADGVAAAAPASANVSVTVASDAGSTISAPADSGSAGGGSSSGAGSAAAPADNAPQPAVDAKGDVKDQAKAAAGSGGQGKADRGAKDQGKGTGGGGADNGSVGQGNGNAGGQDQGKGAEKAKDKGADKAKGSGNGAGNGNGAGQGSAGSQANGDVGGQDQGKGADKAKDKGADKAKDNGNAGSGSGNVSGAAPETTAAQGSGGVSDEAGGQDKSKPDKGKGNGQKSTTPAAPPAPTPTPAPAPPAPASGGAAGNGQQSDAAQAPSQAAGQGQGNGNGQGADKAGAPGQDDGAFSNGRNAKPRK